MTSVSWSYDLNTLSRTNQIFDDVFKIEKWYDQSPSIFKSGDTGKRFKFIIYLEPLKLIN